MEGLVLAGAFDSIYPNRKALFENIEAALDYGSRAQEYLEKITDSLFGGSDDMMQINEPELRFTMDWSEAERLRREREMLGFYLTGHPLRKYELEASSFSSIRLGEAGEMADEDAGGLERVVGVVTEINVKLDKNGKKMAFMTINDLTGACECMMFSSVYEKCGEKIEPEKVFVFQGYTEKAGDNLKLRLENVIPVEESRDILTKYIEIIIDRDNHTPDIIARLEPILRKHKGNLPVHIRLLSSGEYDDQKFRLKNLTVSNNSDTVGEITRLIGENFVNLAVSKM